MELNISCLFFPHHDGVMKVELQERPHHVISTSQEPQSYTSILERQMETGGCEEHEPTLTGLKGTKKGFSHLGMDEDDIR